MKHQAYGVHAKAQETGFLGGRGRKHKMAKAAPKRHGDEEKGEPKMSKAQNAKEEAGETASGMDKQNVPGGPPQQHATPPGMGAGPMEHAAAGALMGAANGAMPGLGEDDPTPSNPHLLVHMGGHHLFRLKRMM